MTFSNDGLQDKTFPDSTTISITKTYFIDMDPYTFNTGCDCCTILLPGIVGPQGVPGTLGSIGPQGEQGSQGLQGIPGPQGDTGVIGPSFSLVGSIQNFTAFQLEGDADTWRFVVSNFNTDGSAVGEDGLYLQNPPFVPENATYSTILYTNSLVNGITTDIYEFTATLDQVGMTLTLGGAMTTSPTLDIYGYNVDEDNIVTSVTQLTLLAQATFSSVTNPYVPLRSETVIALSKRDITDDFTHIGVEIVLREVSALLESPTLSFESQRFTFMIARYQE